MSANPYLDLLQTEEQSKTTDAAATRSYSAPAGTALPANPYLKTLQEDRATEETRRRAALRIATPVSPDDAASAARLSQKTGMPHDVVLRNLKDVEAQQASEETDQKLKVSPITAQRMLELPFAQKAHDDVDSLTQIENVLKEWRGPKPTVGSYATGLAANLSESFKAISEGLSGQIADAFEWAGLLPKDEVAEAARVRRMAQHSARAAYTDPDFDSATARAVYGGVASTARMIPGLALSVATRSPAPGLIAAGVQTEAEAFAKYRGRGATPGEAFVGGVGEGAVEVATEMLPMGFLAKQLGRTGMKDFMVGLLARELPTEQVATLLQDAIDTAIANPDKTWAEYAKERPDAAYQTLISTITQSALMGGAHAAVKKLAGQQDRAHVAESDAQVFEQLTKIAEASKLRERDPAGFAEFVQQAAEQSGSPVTEVFIDAPDLAKSFAQSGVSLQELEALAPLATAQLQEALATGNSVRIPVGEFVAAGEKVTKPLLDLIRTAPDAMNRFEAGEFLKADGGKIQAEVEQAMEAQQGAEAFEASRESVRANFEAELQSVGRFTPDVNKAYAEMLASYYGAQASRLGVTPEALLSKYRLRVASSGKGALNQGVAQGAVARGALAGEGNDKAVVAQPLVDGAGADAKVLANLFEGEVTSAQGDGLLSAPALVRVFSAVRTAALNNPKVLDTIVGAVPVDVVNDLFGSQAAAKVALHDQAMLEEGSAFDADVSVAGGLGDAAHPVRLLLSEAARQAAKVPSVPLGAARGSKEGAAAAGASEGSQVAPFLQPNRAAYDPSTNLIVLLKGADLSSFLHESGHAFLSMQADMASQIQAQIASGASVTESERGIVEDMTKLLDWFGIKGSESMSALDVWNTLTLDEQRESHEQFARGFEAYGFEGKAPSIALQGVFQRFRSWLVSIYRSLKNLNVTLTDDVRGVMDRMLATDAAIQEAEAQRNMGPLFKDAKKAGMTDDEYQAYQGLAAASTAAAAAELDTRSLKDMQWLSRAKDKALKARQAEVDDLRRDVKNEIRSEVMAEKVYQAWQFLTGKIDQVAPGEQAVGDVQTVVQSGRLRTDVLRQMYGTEESAVWRTLSARHMTSDERGMHPELAAEALGYDSADALVRELAAAPPPAEVIDARTDQRMLEMFGDITSPDALARAADEAVHNEARARFITAELKAIEKANSVKTGRKSSIDVIARAAKDYAQQAIARLKVREIRPAQYAGAEARNAKLAEKAFPGKLEEAAMHKRNQLVNNYATKAAYQALADVKDAIRYFRKFDKRSKRLDPEYQDQIEQLLERFDFRPASLKDIDKRTSLASWVESQRAMGLEPVIDEALLNESTRQHYREMTVDEVRGLVDAVRNIEHLGRLKNRLLKAKDQREFNAVVAEASESIREHGGKPRPVELEGRRGVRPWLDGFAAGHRKVASLLRQMDGGAEGPMWRLLTRSMNEAATEEAVELEQATLKLAELYKPILKLKGGLSGDKRHIPAINASLTRGGRLSVALNWGNEQNRQRIRDGDGWNDDQVQAVLDTITAPEWKFVQGVWDFIDSYWSDISDKERRVSGVTPKRVEPIAVVTPHGTFRGGYYPIKYDTDRSTRAEQHEAAQAATEMMRGAYTRATTRRGHTKARVDTVKRPVRKSLDVLTQHVSEVVHDLAWHEWLIDTNRVLASKEISGAIRDHYGPEVDKTLKDAVVGIATADVIPQTKIDQALTTFRNNVSRSTMGLSLTTALMQPFGLTQSMVRIGPTHVLRGLARWGGDALRFESSLGWIREKSEFMRLRGQTFNRELHEIKGRVSGDQKRHVFDAALFALMRKMQLVADVPTWIGQYEKSLTAGVDESTAVAQADQAVLDSQGGGQIKDLAEFQRKHPMLTVFYSYFNVTYNLAAESTAKTKFTNPVAVAGWLSDMMLLMVIPALAPAALIHLLRGGGDDPEEWAKSLLKWQVGYLLGTVIGVRELSGFASGFDYTGPPAGRVIVDIGKAGKQTAQGDIDEQFVVSMSRLAGTLFGLPTVQAIRTYKGWEAWANGEAPATAILFGPPPKD